MAEPLTLSTRQAAAFLGVGRNKLLRLFQTKRIKAKDLDGRLRFTTESLREFLAALPDALEAERQRRLAPTRRPRAHQRGSAQRLIEQRHFRLGTCWSSARLHDALSSILSSASAISVRRSANRWSDQRLRVSNE